MRRGAQGEDGGCDWNDLESGGMVKSVFFLTLLLAASLVRAETPASKPATRASTQPRMLIKVSSPAVAPETTPVDILLDVNDAPEVKEWALSAANYAIKWYPEICKKLPTDGFSAPREVTIHFKVMNGVAYTTGQTISVSAAWIKKHPEDLGMIAHELTHVIQHYTRGEKPGWLVEGIADYIRYYFVEPGTKQGGFNPERGYKGGYNPAAGMLNWLEKEHPGIVVKLNTLLREGKYTGEQFKELAGGDPDTEWEAFKETLKVGKVSGPK